MNAYLRCAINAIRVFITEYQNITYPCAPKIFEQLTLFHKILSQDKYKTRDPKIRISGKSTIEILKLHPCYKGPLDIGKHNFPICFPTASVEDD